MSTWRHDQKKVHNRFRPLETQSRTPAGSVGATKKCIWANTRPPSDGFLNLPMHFFFPGACRTRFEGRVYPNRPPMNQFTPIYVYVGVFFPPLTWFGVSRKIDINIGLRAQTTQSDPFGEVARRCAKGPLLKQNTSQSSGSYMIRCWYSFSYTHPRAHQTRSNLVSRFLLYTKN